MRPNHRERIIDAAVRLVYRHGPAGLTQNGTAEEADVSRPGLLYHFPSRSALVEATHQRLADNVAARLVAQVAQDPERTTPGQRACAYAHACADSRTLLELQLMEESTFTGMSSRRWRKALVSWSPRPSSPPACARSTAQLLACLAAEGLMVHESLHGYTLDAGAKQRVVEMIQDLVLASDDRDGKGMP